MLSGRADEVAFCQKSFDVVDDSVPFSESLLQIVLDNLYQCQ